MIGNGESRGLVAEGQTLLDPIFISRMNPGRASQGAGTPRILALEEVAFAGSGAKHFAAGCNLEPLGCGLFGLNTLWTSHSSIDFLQKERAI